MVSEGVYGILKAIQQNPTKTNFQGFLYLSARYQILKYLFRNRLKKHGYQNELKLNANSWFIEREPDKIFNLLYSVRKKKGNRGLKAATKDFQILMLLVQGWERWEIAQELGLKPSHVTDYRKKLRKKLMEVAGVN